MSDKVATATDLSGKVTVSLFVRTALDPAAHFNDFDIAVDEDMIAIGGGARGDETIGALLTASYPRDKNLTSWFVSSKDHIHPDPHHLVGFAIGMKIAGMTRDDLFSNIRIESDDSDIAHDPTAEAELGGDFLLLGGGFHVDYQGAGNIATASFPAPDGVWTKWIARSKDHEQSDPSRITTYAIGIRQQLPAGIVRMDVGKRESASANKHPRSTAVLPNGFVLTGGGAEVLWTGAGNLLWQLEPNVGAFTASSKDHDASDPCNIVTYALGIQLG